MDQNMEMVDRISQLPEPIMHTILSYLPIKEVNRTQVLSKAWNHVWNSFPIVEFNKAFAVEILGDPTHQTGKGAREWHTVLRKRDECLNFVEQTLLSRCRQMLSINKFTLYMPYCDSNLMPLIDRCIEYAVECNVEELDIDIKMMDHKRCKMPKIVFDHFGAKFPNVRYSSLTRLLLSGIYVDDHAVQNLPNSSPGIEDLSFSNCGGLKSLQVSGFLQLKKVNVQRCFELERVDIEAPNLQYFKYHYYRMHVPVEINITTCKNLKTLILYGASMTEKLFNDHIFVFPFLENLELRACNMLEHIKISSHCLKELILTQCQNLVEAKIDAPYLCSFKYRGYDIETGIRDCTWYKFPKIVFDHFGAELPNVRYSSLKILFLSGVYVDDHAVQDLLNSCPGIEDLNFSECGRLTSLQVSDFLQLKKVNVQRCVDLERVDIEAPNLQYFKYHYDSRHVRAEINITSCKNLKTLILHGANMTEKSFHDHISVFPLLENLELCRCNMLEHIKISSCCLKELNVTHCRKLVEAKIDAPYLCSFNYCGNMLTLSMNAVALSRAKLSINRKVINTFLYVKFMEFLGQLNHAKELILYRDLEDIIISKELKQSLIPPPCSANHLTLRTGYYEPHEILESVDSVLWMFSHLDSLSIESKDEDDTRNNMSFKFVYEKQLDREENLPWQHCLKEVKIEGAENVWKWKLKTEDVWNLKKFFFENAKNLKKVDSMDKLLDKSAETLDRRNKSLGKSSEKLIWGFENYY